MPRDYAWRRSAPCLYKSSNVYTFTLLHTCICIGAYSTEYVVYRKRRQDRRQSAMHAMEFYNAPLVRWLAAPCPYVLTYSPPPWATHSVMTPSRHSIVNLIIRLVVQYLKYCLFCHRQHTLWALVLNAAYFFCNSSDFTRFCWRASMWCNVDVDETPFELRKVTIRRDKCFAEEFEIIDFLGR